MSSSCIGGLEGALDAFLQIGGANVSRNFLGRTAEDPSAQMAVAATVEALDAMRLALLRNFDHMLGCAQLEQPAALEERLLYRYQSARVADICAEHISRLFQSCGAAGVYLDKPLVRRFLDIHTARSHVANCAAPLGRSLGGYLMGLDNRDPTVQEELPMIVDLSLRAPASLAEPRHFRAIMVHASCGVYRLPDLACGHADVLAALDRTHAWVRLDWLRAQLPDARWRAELEAMVDAARAHGWVRADGSAVRGHMQWSGS